MNVSVQSNQLGKSCKSVVKTFKYADITSQIIGAAMEVHRILKNGFQEVIYQRALEREMQIKGLRANREFEMPIFYKSELIGTRRVDFLVENVISVELKAVNALDDVHLAQALNYLEAYNLEVGLLLNFGAKILEFKRLLNPKYKPNPTNPINPH